MYNRKQSRNFFVKAEVNLSQELFLFTDNLGREFHFTFRLCNETWTERAEIIKDCLPNSYYPCDDKEKAKRDNPEEFVTIWWRDGKLRNYYFTFCNGDAKRNSKYVKIEAADWNEAREKMLANFGTYWAFKYTESEFNDIKARWPNLEEL